MTALRVDAVGHQVDPGIGTNLTAAAVSVTTAGTIAGTTAAGAAPTVAVPSGFRCNDRTGTFDLTAVTGGGAQAAGDVATVRFVQPYAQAPNGVILTLHDVTAAPDAVRAACATAVTPAGFNVNVAAALTTATAYRVSYVVLP